MSKGQSPINPAEIGNTYLGDEDRFVVSLVVGYSEEDGVNTPREALAAALQLVTGEGSPGTHWYVFDRQARTMHMLIQGSSILGSSGGSEVPKISGDSGGSGGFVGFLDDAASAIGDRWLRSGERPLTLDEMRRVTDFLITFFDDKRK